MNAFPIVKLKYLRGFREVRAVMNAVYAMDFSCCRSFLWISVGLLKDVES